MVGNARVFRGTVSAKQDPPVSVGKTEKWLHIGLAIWRTRHILAAAATEDPGSESHKYHSAAPEELSAQPSSYAARYCLDGASHCQASASETLLKGGRYRAALRSNRGILQSIPVMHFLVLSTSLRSGSRSERLARHCSDRLTEMGASNRFVSIKDHMLPGFDDGSLGDSEAYRYLYEVTGEADGLILASPVYNWGVCAELKRYVEWLGNTPHGHKYRGAFHDKTVSFACAAGVPHSYMAFGSLALSMMLDFKCIINPYHVYLHDRHWDESGRLTPEALTRINKSMSVMVEITRCLESRTYESKWEV